MKTILVLTDFSESARNAADAAIIIAEAIKADIILLNAFVIATMMVTTEPMPWPLEYYKILEQDSIDQLKLEQDRLVEQTLKKDSADHKINISTMSRGGSLSDGLAYALKHEDIIMVTMGGRHNKGSELLFGSDIMDVINNANRPVFINSVIKLSSSAKNVVFATDLSHEDVNGLNYVISLSKYFGFHIHVCHVAENAPESTTSHHSNHISEFENKIDRSKLSCLSFNELKGNHIKDELTKYSNAIDADILILTHKKHSFFWRMVHETPATDLVKIHKQPLLILPCSNDPAFFQSFLPLHSFIPDASNYSSANTD